MAKKITRTPKVITYEVRRLMDRRPPPKELRRQYFTLGQAMRMVFRHIELYSSLMIIQITPGVRGHMVVAEVRVGHVLPRWSRGLAKRPK